MQHPVYLEPISADSCGAGVVINLNAHRSGIPLTRRSKRCGCTGAKIVAFMGSISIMQPGDQILNQIRRHHAGYALPRVLLCKVAELRPQREDTQT